MCLFSFVVTPHFQPLPQLGPLFLIYAVLGHLPLRCIPTAQLVSLQYKPSHQPSPRQAPQAQNLPLHWPVSLLGAAVPKCLVLED